MENEIARLRQLAEDFEKGLLKLSQAPESGDPIDILKKDLIRIEGSIDYSIDNLLSLIHKDDRIPSDKRQEHLETTLNQLSVDLDQFRIRRRSTFNAAAAAIQRMSEESFKNKRLMLLGENAKDEIMSTVSQKNTTTASLASDITTRLERTRNVVENQVAATQLSLYLMQESTNELHGVNDASAKAEIAQAAASRSLLRLRIAQNWDRYMLKASLWIFAFSVIYVTYYNLTHNLVVTIIRKVFSIFGIIISKIASPSTEGNVSATNTPLPTTRADL